MRNTNKDLIISAIHARRKHENELDEKIKQAVIQGKSYAQIKSELLTCNRRITEVRRGLVGAKRKLNQYDFYK
jgi:hypothetical protein